MDKDEQKALLKAFLHSVDAIPFLWGAVITLGLYSMVLTSVVWIQFDGVKEDVRELQMAHEPILLPLPPPGVEGPFPENQTLEIHEAPEHWRGKA
jgi:hypothetical protein